MNVVRVLAYFVYFLLDAVMIAMFLRALLPWFSVRDDNPVFEFVCMVTEPFLLPLRMLFYKMNWFQQTPIDISYMATYFVLVILSYFLRTLL